MTGNGASSTMVGIELSKLAGKKRGGRKGGRLFSNEVKHFMFALTAKNIHLSETEGRLKLFGPYADTIWAFKLTSPFARGRKVVLMNFST
jgi:hypothetical protein